MAKVIFWSWFVPSSYVEIMEIYTPNDKDVQTLETADYTISLSSYLKFFARRWRPYLKSCLNKYVWSYDNYWLGIMPIRTKYRVFGQIDKPYIKRLDLYDVYFIGDLQECIDKWVALVRLCLPQVKELC